MFDVKDLTEEIDLKLILLAGDPLKTNNIEIKPLKLKEITKIGYSLYSKYLSLLTIDKNKIVDDSEKYEELSLVELIYETRSEDIIRQFLDAICFFLHTDKEAVIYHEHYGIIIGDIAEFPNVNRVPILNKDNYDDFVKILKYQNCITTKIDNSKPANERARKILEKIRRSKEIINQVKAKQAINNGNSIDFADIVSSVSTKSNSYNKHSIWDVTIYQLYDEYKRLEAINNYEFNLKALLQGAKTDELKHWSSSLD
ncbi:hypothetical protein B7C51_25215 (plasmid) [Paenibacillus larvae subsp. pulvifaciens]|uniref:Uncharacterized protein n=1 Tax=Paenibacillus larvae subsp. pulvifaciens TaxID=1477 RepID=A0A1V0V075_9BACL|nr:hypothetical protein [Paenibacillus larvae]ARF70773.1 hypothetical protein B7C51_25215 [Paenibacillus larvae subsp. pulvifaciens]